MVDAKKICKSLPGAKRDYCENLVTACYAERPEGARIELDLLNGTTEYFDYSDECASYAKYRAGFGVPGGFRRSAIPSGSTAEPAEPPAPAPLRLTDYCDVMDSKGTLAHGQCMTYMGICAASDTGPYELPYKGSIQRTDYQDECISLSLYYASTLMSKASLTGRTVRGGGIDFTPDGNKRHAIGIRTAGFHPEVHDRVQIEDLTLRFMHDWEVYAVRFKIAYKLVKTGRDSYSLRYSILKPDFVEKKPFEEAKLEMEIAFTTDGHKITDPIGFGVTLSEEGDFSKPTSIQLVRVKS